MPAPRLHAENFRHFISPVADLLEEARQGRMYILVDAEDRENEGDLVIPAQFASPDAVNFMAKYGRGLICLALTAERAAQLDLSPMSRRNQTRHQTAFTASIEAREGVSTGISAHDRAHTIAVAIDPTKSAADIVSPGHVFPLIAREGGVLTRAGHTEAGVDIARLTGLIPAAVICEVMNDDGTMARMPDLVAFAKRHDLKIGTIADLIAYRRANEVLVERVSDMPMTTRFGDGFRLLVYRNKLDRAETAVITRGEISPDRPTLVRMHRLDLQFDLLGVPGPRADLIDYSFADIAAEPEGGVIVLLRDSAPDAFSRRIREHADQTHQREHLLREYGVGAQILRDLGVKRMILISDAPQKIIGIEGYGLSVEGWRPFRRPGRS